MCHQHSLAQYLYTLKRVLKHIITSFLYTLLKLEPKLSNIVAVGTAGEQAIIKVLRAVFGDSFISLRCFIHMKDNIKRKLAELQLPDKIKDEIIKDVFGFQQGALYVKGILESESVAIFDVRFLLLKTRAVCAS